MKSPAWWAAAVKKVHKIFRCIRSEVKNKKERKYVIIWTNNFLFSEIVWSTGHPTTKKDINESVGIQKRVIVIIRHVDKAPYEKAEKAGIVNLKEKKKKDE